MAKFKYKKPLILLGIYYIFWIVIFVITIVISPPGTLPDFTPFVPGAGFIDIILILLVLIPIISIICGFLIGYILAPLFLFIHKKILGKKFIYGIQERPRPTKFKKTLQAFFPAVMAINFALIIVLNEDMVGLILSPEAITIAANEAELFIISMLVSPLFTIGISMALFSPIWFLLDAGISYSNQKKVDNTEKLVESKSVGGYYYNFLKGYVGIGVIIAYYQVIAEIFAEHIGLSPQFIINILIFALFMFLLTIAAIPAVIILDLTKEHRIKYVRKRANKMGITESVEVVFRNI